MASRVPIIRRDRDSISEQKCSVCGSLTREFHFGAVCCVACGAFFRRAVSEGRVFVCRRNPGTASCAIEANARATCRSCRFQKCLQVGMDPAAVQPPRGAIGKRRESPPSRGSELGDPQHTNGKVNYAKELEYFEPREPICVESPRNSVENLYIEYQKLKETRKLIFSNGTLLELLNGDPPRPRKTNIFNRIRKEAIRGELGLVVQMMRTCRIFNSFELEDREELFKNLALTMSIMEKYYTTMKMGGIEEERIYHVDGTYTDLNDDVSELPAASNGIKMDKDTIRKLFIEPCFHNIQQLAIPMKKMEMNDIDFIGLVSFCFFDPDLFPLGSNTRHRLEKARAKVHNDWCDLYTQKNIQNGQMRVIQCLRLIPTVQDMVEKYRENFHLMRVFELYEYDEILADILSMPRDEKHNSM